MTASFGNVDTYASDIALLVGDGPTVSRNITLLSGQNQPRGAVLGKVTASGKYKLALAAANDGSEVPSVILAEACDASAADKVTVAYFAATVDESALTYGTGHTAATCREPLRDVGINLQAAIA